MHVLKFDEMLISLLKSVYHPNVISFQKIHLNSHTYVLCNSSPKKVAHFNLKGKFFLFKRKKKLDVKVLKNRDNLI